jgi:hypothetical protein
MYGLMFASEVDDINTKEKTGHVIPSGKSGALTPARKSSFCQVRANP